jgi:methylsterol monooxygenase
MELYVFEFLFILIKNIFYVLGIDYVVDKNNKKHNPKYIQSKNHNSLSKHIYYLIGASVVETLSFNLIAKLINVNMNVNYLYTFLLFIPISFLVEIIFDFFHYWTHRLAHTNDFLYKYVHKTHHETTKLTAIVTFFQNPIDYILTNFIPFFLALSIIKYIFGIKYDLFMYSLLNIYKEFIEIAGHTIQYKNTPSFPQFIWLPKYFYIELLQKDHHNHHKYVQCNYSKRFTLWDKLFETYKY